MNSTENKAALRLDQLRAVSGDDMAILTDYGSYLANERDYSPHTVKAYLADTGQFLGWCAANRPGRGLAGLTRHDVRSWLSSLQGAGNNAASRNRKLVAVRGFFSWAISEGRAVADPTDGMERAKQAKPLPRFVTPEEANKMIDSAISPTWRALRDKAMLEVFFGSGLRLAELSNLDLGDVDLEGRTLRVRHGKGDKERVVPIHSLCAASLKTWLSCRPATDEKALFVGPHGRLAPRQIAERVDAAGRRAGIGHVNPHALRHGCATALTAGGASLLAVQQMLGHSSVSTTQRYVHLSVANLITAHNLAHPRAHTAK